MPDDGDHFSFWPPMRHQQMCSPPLRRIIRHTSAALNQRVQAGPVKANPHDGTCLFFSAHDAIVGHGFQNLSLLCVKILLARYHHSVNAAPQLTKIPTGDELREHQLQLIVDIGIYSAHFTQVQRMHRGMIGCTVAFTQHISQHMPAWQRDASSDALARRIQQPFVICSTLACRAATSGRDPHTHGPLPDNQTQEYMRAVLFALEMQYAYADPR